MNLIPGSWQHVLIIALLIAILLVCIFALLLVPRPKRRQRIRVGLDARHGCAPQLDERDTVAVFRRIVCDQRTRLGI